MKIQTAITLSSVIVLITVCAVSLGLPVLDGTSGIDNETIDELKASVNGSPKNLYVVKAVVYEIGILTEVGDNDTSFESQERVDLTFFDAHSNQSHIDLGNIPLPIQTNISGQVLTGIAPINIGAFSSPSELLETLPLTGTIVNITHSNTAFYQLTKSNATQHAPNTHVVNSDELMNLPDIGNLFPTVAAKHGHRSTEETAETNSVERHDDD